MKDYKDKNDGKLVELTLLGDDRAYETLVTRHQRSVKGTAYKVTGNEFSAEDASQDAFVSAWVNLDSLREREKIRLLGVFHRQKLRPRHCHALQKRGGRYQLESH